ncbi:ATP-dependent DNA helicase [Trichonephila clavipes]|nr:ATP-dependent DNA helicase [Trichonephila clavipes]
MESSLSNSTQSSRPGTPQVLTNGLNCKGLQNLATDIKAYSFAIDRCRKLINALIQEGLTDPNNPIMMENTRVFEKYNLKYQQASSKRQKFEENQESNDLTRITVEVEVHQEQDNSQPSTSTLPIKRKKTSTERVQDISEHIPIEESLTAQQHTLSWDEEQYLCIAPGEQNVPRSLLFDEHAEELSFPSIYLGEFRRFREGIKATPFMMASSELRRSDRRAVTPHHLLYVAMKIMRLRVRDSLTIAFKHVGKNTTVTRQQIEDEHYINNCIETNLAFYDQFRIQHGIG